MKTCSRCHQEKPLTEFGAKSASRDGLNYWCKECNRSYVALYSFNKDGIMNKKRFDAILRSQTTIVKKVFAGLSPTEYRSQQKIISELFASGVKLSVHEVKGCLGQLVNVGLVIEQSSGLFITVKVSEKNDTIETREEMKPTKFYEPQKATTAEPVRVEHLTLVEKLVNISVKLSDHSNFLKTLSTEIDTVADEIDRTMKEGTEETKKLQQLKDLLKSLG